MPTQRRIRSHGYPLLDLRAVVHMLRDNFRKSDRKGQNRAELAVRLGYQNDRGGVAARKIAALVHYGLFNRQGGKFFLTTLGTLLLEAGANSPPEEKLLSQALEHPALFRKILEECRSLGQIPANLPRVLEGRFFGIAPQASQLAAEVFARSARFAGVIDTNGKLRTTAPGANRGAELALPMPSSELVSSAPQQCHRHLQIQQDEKADAHLYIRLPLDAQMLSRLKERIASKLDLLIEDLERTSTPQPKPVAPSKTLQFVKKQD